MTGSHIQWDDDAIAKVQAKANALAQDVVRQVNAEMSGQPVNKVMAALQKRLLAVGVKPDIKGLLPYTKEISAGTLAE